jgi:hypothetical protein
MLKSRGCQLYYPSDFWIVLRDVSNVGNQGKLEKRLKG